MKCFCGSFPSSDPAAGFGEGRNPDIAARVLEQSEDIAGRQSVPGRVNRFRRRGGQPANVIVLWIADQPLTRREPPFSSSILERKVIPAPPEVGEALRNLGANRAESLSVKQTDGRPRVYRHYSEVSAAAFKER